jgi:hypothetical protein
MEQLQILTYNSKKKISKEKKIETRAMSKALSIQTSEKEICHQSNNQIQNDPI